MNRILVLSPHPDDESIGCGGTLCKRSLAGDLIHLVCLTSGERGGHGQDPSAAGRTREEEALEAASILGIQSVEFWREPDGRLQPSQMLVNRLADKLRAWEPSFIFVTHEAEAHPDHRAAAQLLRFVRNSSANWSAMVRTYEVWTPLETMDHIEDISEQMETKQAAIRAYRSQCAVLRFDEAMLGLARYRGEMHSWPGGDYAEVFRGLSK